ncbi:MAG: sigma 54-interacting transcriptional regulator [bacterium]
MKIPPFIQIWSNNKRRKFYLFKDERIYFNENGFYSSSLMDSCLLDDVPNSLIFKLDGEKILVRPQDEKGAILVAGSKKRCLIVDKPTFFTFNNYEFFIDNIGKEEGFFNLTGLASDLDFVNAMAYARNDNPVLIVGNTGTGKEILAKNIHYNSSRRHEPFLVFNCASFDPATAQSELFGNVKGAFTSAMSVSKGIFMNAGRGSILLDDIGNLPMSVQPMLLRAIESSELKPVGADIVRNHKARMIFTSNVSPNELLRTGSIREDLYYRIESCTVYLSELKNKKQLIPALLRFYLGDDYVMDDDIMNLLNEYEWPGNIREFKTVIEQAKMMCDICSKDSSKKIEKRFISLNNKFDLSCSDIRDPSKVINIVDSEKDKICQALQRNSWNLERASHALNICRSTLLTKIKEHKLIKF